MDRTIPIDYGDLFYQHGLTLIPAWISNYIHYRVWDEIVDLFTNFNAAFEILE